MRGSRKIERLFKSGFFLSSFLFLSTCATKENQEELQLPKIDKVEQIRSNEINILVDKQNKGSFKTSILLNQDVSMFNTGTQEKNPYMFIKKVQGENIDDISFLGKQEDCLMVDEQSVDRQSRKFVCTFDFEVTANSNWKSKNIVREVHSITYSIFDTEIVSPVSIKVFEKIESTELINSSQIFRNSNFYNFHSTNTTNNEYMFALNWNYAGLGKDLPDDDKKIHIRNLNFHFNYLTLEKSFLLIDNLYGQEIDPPREDELQGSNFDYQLTGEQVWWSDNFLFIYISFNSNNTSYKQVADFLEMEYSINESLETKKVLLASIQLYDFVNI